METATAVSSSQQQDTVGMCWSRQRAAEALNLSVDTVDRLVKRGEIVAYKLDGRTLISVPSLHDFLERHTIQPEAR